MSDAESDALEGRCYDCGGEPVWWFAPESHKCRRCLAKGGDRDYVEIDPDKLLAFLQGCGGEWYFGGGDEENREAARTLLSQCERTW